MINAYEVQTIFVYVLFAGKTSGKGLNLCVHITLQLIDTISNLILNFTHEKISTVICNP